MNKIPQIPIGERIKRLRHEAGLTQSELAGDTVTRNMLSMIESGKSLPSVETLLELCRRLGVSPGYLFADSREESMYRKDAVIDRIVTLFSEQSFDAVISLCAELEDDNEIGFYSAFSHLNKGLELFRASPRSAIELHLLPSLALSENRPFYGYVENTVEFASLLTEYAGADKIPKELCDQGRFFPCAFPPELFAYLSALSFLENGDAHAADVLAKSGLMHSSCYLLHIEGAVIGSEGGDSEALKLLVRASQEPGGTFFSTLRLYTDIEHFAQKLGDYKLAYEYSSKHLALIGNVRK